MKLHRNVHHHENPCCAHESCCRWLTEKGYPIWFDFEIFFYFETLCRNVTIISFSVCTETVDLRSKFYQKFRWKKKQYTAHTKCCQLQNFVPFIEKNTAHINAEFYTLYYIMYFLYNLDSHFNHSCPHLINLVWWA